MLVAASAAMSASSPDADVAPDLDALPGPEHLIDRPKGCFDVGHLQRCHEHAAEGLGRVLDSKSS